MNCEFKENWEENKIFLEKSERVSGTLINIIVPETFFTSLLLLTDFTHVLT